MSCDSEVRGLGAGISSARVIGFKLVARVGKQTVVLGLEVDKLLAWHTVVSSCTEYMRLSPVRRGLGWCSRIGGSGTAKLRAAQDFP